MINPSALLAVFKPPGKRSPYSKLNPMSRFLAFLAFLILPIISSDLIFQMMILVIQAPLVHLSYSKRRLFVSIKSSFVLIALIFLLNYITMRDPVFSGSMVLRLINMVVASAIFMASTDPSELGDLLTKLRVPYHIAFAFVIALRFIPTLAEDVEHVMASQASRGLEMEGGKFWERVKKMIPLLVPLIIIAIRRGYQLAEALESRAFGSVERRGYYIVYEWGSWDYFLILYVILSATLVTSLFVVRPPPHLISTLLIP